VSWRLGQASCTAGRASFNTGRIPIRSALSIVVAPGDPNALKKETPTIAEFFKKNGYSTYFSGKWHLGDKPEAYPIEHGFDEMKHFGAYYPGVYAYNDTSPRMHPWFPSYNAEFNRMYNSIVNLGEWEGEAGQPPGGPAPSTGIIWRRSTFGRLIRQSPTSSRMRRATNPSSWMSTS
jgi:arylsulfatase